MDIGLRNSLNEIFERYEESKRGRPTAKDVAESKNAQFLADFTERQETVVRPVMDAVGKYMLSRGFEYEVYQAEDGYDGFGGETEPKVGFALVRPPRIYRLHEYPGLAVIGEKHSKTVRFHARMCWPTGGGQAGPFGAVTLDELTTDLVKTKLLRVISTVLS